MKAVIVGFVGAGSTPAAIVQAYDASNNPIGVYQEAFSLAYSDTTPTDYINDILPQVATGLSADTLLTYTAADISMIWGSVVGRVFSTPSLAINTSRQASTSRDAFVSAAVDITASLSLITGQTGKVALQYADNTGFTTNVTNVQQGTNGNTGSLTIGLNLGQIVTATVSGIIPAGKYYRLVTTNVTGTPTFGTPAIQEVLL